MFRWLLLLFIAVPTAELAVLLYSGSKIGVLPTVLIILITGFGGAYLAKRVGFRAWRDLMDRMRTMDAPGNALIDSFFILIGGLLLIMPGFITDLCGLLLLFKWPRKMLRPIVVAKLYNMMRRGQIVIR